MNEVLKKPYGIVSAGGNGSSNISAFLDEHASGAAGTLFKFAKDQRFRRVSDDEEVPLGKEFIVIYDQIMVGWIRFFGAGAPPERKMGPLLVAFCPARGRSLEILIRTFGIVAYLALLSIRGSRRSCYHCRPPMTATCSCLARPLSPAGAPSER